MNRPSKIHIFKLDLKTPRLNHFRRLARYAQNKQVTAMSYKYNMKDFSSVQN